MTRRDQQLADQIGEQFDTVLEAARAGAGWAAASIWRSLAPAVAGYLRVQGAADPDDLTSEVFLGVFRGLPAFDGDEQQLRSWVFTIAHRRLTDQRRQDGRRPPPTSLDHDHHEGPAAPSAEHGAIGRLGTQRVQQLCEQLVPDQRDVLLLRLVGGLTVEEVAQSLEKSPGAVKALQRRGLASLRRILEREGVPL